MKSFRISAFILNIIIISAQNTGKCINTRVFNDGSIYTTHNELHSKYETNDCCNNKSCLVPISLNRNRIISAKSGRQCANRGDLLIIDPDFADFALNKPMVSVDFVIGERIFCITHLENASSEVCKLWDGSCFKTNGIVKRTAERCFSRYGEIITYDSDLYNFTPTINYSGSNEARPSQAPPPPGGLNLQNNPLPTGSICPAPMEAVAVVVTTGIGHGEMTDGLIGVEEMAKTQLRPTNQHHQHLQHLRRVTQPLQHQHHQHHQHLRRVTQPLPHQHHQHHQH